MIPRQLTTGFIASTCFILIQIINLDLHFKLRKKKKLINDTTWL